MVLERSIKIDARMSAARTGFLATSPNSGKGFQGSAFPGAFRTRRHMLRFEIAICRHWMTLTIALPH